MAATDTQKYVFSKFEILRFGLVYDALTRMQEAHDAIAPLPQKNAEGESVVHGDNLQMHGLKDVYFFQAMAVYNYLSDEQQAQIERMFPKWKNKFY
jgi:hypothetical protein